MVTFSSNFPVISDLDTARATFVTKKFVPNPKLPGCISLGRFQSAVPLGQIISQSNAFCKTLKTKTRKTSASLPK